MSRLTRLTILSAMTLGLVACGGAKLGGGKEGAAQAAFQASQPAGRGSQTAQSLVKQAMASGAATLTVKANCAKSGTVSLSLDSTAGTEVGAIGYTVTYDACNEDGKNEYNGTMTTAMTFDIDVTNDNVNAALTVAMKGKLNIDGEVSDFIDADVKMTMNVNATSANAGSVSLVVDGTIKTSEGSYTYAKETISVTAGELPKA